MYFNALCVDSSILTMTDAVRSSSLAVLVKKAVLHGFILMWPIGCSKVHCVIEGSPVAHKHDFQGPRLLEIQLA